MWKLAIEDDEGKRIVLPLTADQYTIGRKEGNAIRLTERNVSREHARIYKKNGATKKPAAAGPSVPAPAGPPGADSGFVLEDLTSYNGVFVNGLRVNHAQPLVNGDLVQIGDYRILMQDEAAEGEPIDVVSNDVKQTVPGVKSPHAAQLSRPNRLVMLAGPSPGTEFALEDERLTIGRAAEAAISVNHNSVSRFHCEVHALGDGRFEVIDKDSSNGVRVNGTDLRRGIIEPGDVIELGDVQFKFVAAGQIFRPSQAPPLAALGNREAMDTFSTRRRSNAVPIAIFTSVVALGTLAAWLYTRRAPEPHAAAIEAVAPAPPSPGRVALDEAKALCAAGDCDGAHAKLAAAIEDSSPLRSNADFREVETKWADQVLARADAETDSNIKQSLYQRVSQDMAVDSARRKAAADKLQQLETLSNGLSPLPPATVVTSAKAPKSDEAVAVARAEPAKRAAAAPEPAAAPSPPPAATPKAGSDDRERQLALQNTTESKTLLKQQLEQKVTRGTATELEIRLLVSTCKELGDRTCVSSARAALAKLQGQ
jgi:pSer/pThr/pTyr-binding forkhead associated (FHA) protein